MYCFFNYSVHSQIFLWESTVGFVGVGIKNQETLLAANVGMISIISPAFRQNCFRDTRRYSHTEIDITVHRDTKRYSHKEIDITVQREHVEI